MHKVEITLEKTFRVAETFEVSDSVYEEMKNTQRIPDDYFDKMGNLIEASAGDVEFDYAVYDEDKGKDIIRWENC